MKPTTVFFGSNANRATPRGSPGRPRGLAYLDLQTEDDDAMASIVGASSEASHRSYRLAFGPDAGLGVPAETR